MGWEKGMTPFRNARRAPRPSIEGHRWKRGYVQFRQTVSARPRLVVSGRARAAAWS